MKRKDEFTVEFIVPILSLLLGIVISFLCSTALIDGIVLTLVLTVTLTLIEVKFKISRNQSEEETMLENIQAQVSNLQFGDSFLEQIRKQEHPYFQRNIQKKLNEFINENADLLNGVNYTDPHSEDTFGVAGLLYTKENGSIMALSSVPDYWSDSFIERYLSVQEDLIKNHNVVIKRIFVIKPGEQNNSKKMLNAQRKIGIQVYYIYSDNDYIDPNWLQEDYLIQDDQLLVEISCNSHTFSGTTEKTEKITINPAEVKNKIDRFNRLIERSCYWNGRF